eukprot:MONOS_3063.1-p1 / transcript=MONOS_3063.1 / gene=MONOS_3063 / organism=Monocercomonoides_exilis_PA203 / gene_product=unspecified product / transcript_product=unspecified product / location=Mono_scaffold00068:92313-93235(-) / protein_length=289 / sequence_SO=supercontig / SO=protein_coding / is_pseudo=false
MSCLLKVALKKEENEVTQKEVEIALLALGNIEFYEVPKELYLNELKEIIEHQQKHRNLTSLAYQSAWQFFIYRFYANGFLEDTIANELHFGREAARELEDLIKCVDSKRNTKENGGKEAKEVLLMWRWLYAIYDYLPMCELWNEELVGLLGSIVKLFRAAKDNYPDFRDDCLITFGRTAENTAVEIGAFLKSGAIGLFLEEVKQSTLEDEIMWNCLNFFLNISKRLKEKEEDEKKEEERKDKKRKIFERMEEEGFEDIVESLCDEISIQNEKYYNSFSLNISDYFVSG